MSRRELARTLALVFAVGVVGGFFGIAVTTWLADGPKILGASWWEVMTAIGTIGAASSAVWIANRVDKKAEEERTWRKLTLKWFLMEKLMDILFATQLARSELQDIVGKGGGLEEFNRSSRYLTEAISSLDLKDVAVHIESLYVLEDLAPQYGEIFSLARAMSNDLSRLQRLGVAAGTGTAYLSSFIERCSDLREKVETLIQREQGTP